MIRLDRHSRRYFDLYRKKMRDSNVRLELVDDLHIMYNDLPAAGLFMELYGTDYLAELSIAVGGPPEDWFPVFVHETSHMDQFLEASKYWQNVYIVVDGKRIEGVDILDAYISGESFPRELLWKAVDRAVAVEWDCESRVVQKIRQFELPINESEYVQRANAYLYLYRMALEFRMWTNPNKAIYDIDAIWSKMPKRLLPLRSYRTIPVKYKRLYMEYCF